MKLSIMNICRVLAISLLLGVIWQGMALAATMPSFEPLGGVEQGLSHPTCIDIDADGNIYVVDSRRQAVVKLDKFGQVVAEFRGSYNYRGLAVAPDGAKIYVSRKNAVLVLDGDTGDVQGYLGKGAGEFTTAGEIDLDSSGFVYVADCATRYIKVYNPQGEFQYQFGGLGYSKTKLVSIVAMSINEATGEVYVADPVVRRRYTYPEVQVYDLAGNYLRSIRGYYDFGREKMGYFGGMTFDEAGRGYFLDKYKGIVHIMGLPKAYLGSLAQNGYGEGRLILPYDVAFDPSTDRLFALSDDGRIEIFGIDGGQNPVNANEPPGMPTPVSPIADSEVASATPQLEFENAADPDGDTLTYDGRLYLDGALANEYVGQPESEAVSYIQVGDELVENARYEWQARAFDGEDASGWSGAESFYVNAVEEPPAAPVLVEPLDDALVDGDSVLSWNESTDPDPFDTVSYAVEISSDPSFSSLDVTEDVDGLSVVLGDLQQYRDLVDGQTYYWRVVARDNHDLLSEPSAAGTFIYDTTIIKVTANTPGAKVYMNGNLGYPGLPVGEAPVELRDVKPGVHSVVVERSGLEPFVAQVAPAYRENVEVYAAQVPAITPADLKARPLEADGDKIAIGEPVAPFLVDFDNDGLIDLLYGADSGSLSLAPGIVTEDDFAFGAPLTVELSSVVGGLVPFVVDWNNDERKDLIVGAADGTVTFFRNTGTESAPIFDDGEALTADGEVLAVTGPAVPAVYDIDGDADKDLLVGTGGGEVLIFRNDGEDGEPQLVAAGSVFVMPGDVGSVSGHVAPFFADWDGDGSRELLAATGQHLYVCERSTGNTFVANSVLSVADALLSNNKGKKENGAFSLGSGLRLFALDLDGKKGKDIVVGNGAGELRYVASFGKDYVPSLKQTLLDKVSQIDGMVGESTPELSTDVAEIAAAVDAEDYKTANRLARQLGEKVAPGTDLAIAVDELIEISPKK